MKDNIKMPVHQRYIIDDYKKIASSYEKRWPEFVKETSSYVLDAWQSGNNKEDDVSVIDIGCGTGYMLQEIHNEYPKYKLTGIDISADMLDMARQNVPHAFIVEDDVSGNCGEWINIKYEMVLSINILHHIEDYIDHIKMLSSLCNSGGSIFLCDFAIDNYKMRLAEIYWRIFHKSHRRAFSTNNLRRVIDNIDEVKIISFDNLYLTKFWNLQIYHLKKL